jgi:ferredoxin
VRLNHFFSAAPRTKLTGWRRRTDPWLRRIGPTWRSAPWRRVIQVLCLALFFHLFFQVSWPYAPVFTSQILADKEWLPVEGFLWLDPLVGLSTAIAARAWNIAIIGMLGILALGILLPRAFCGYLCPLGTLIDGFDFLVGRRVSPTRVKVSGRWANLRFHLLAAVLVAAVFGVLLSGFVAAIPVLTRGLAFTGAHAQLGWLKHWNMVPPFTAGVVISIALFALVFLLGLMGPRFWCRYVCPSGALLSLPGWLRFSRRRVTDACIDCGKCVEVCPFDAINPDFGTRALACTVCQTCGGVCPTQAIQFGSALPLPIVSKPATALDHPLSRRAMLLSTAAGAASAFAVQSGAGQRPLPIRPPGSVPEGQFLDLCIRCEQCLKVCPGPVLQADGLANGFESLWTPVAIFPHAGCHQDCNFCTQVCPTGAITPLSLTEKRRTQMGLAVVHAKTCLPHRGERDCQLCFDECNAAGYRAIEMREIKLPMGEIPAGAFSADDVEAMGRILAPFVNPDLCTGCGLCEYRCHTSVCKQQHLLERSAIVVAGVALQRLLPPRPA